MADHEWDAIQLRESYAREDAAEARGYARGRAEVLAKVRALPSPTRLVEITPNWTPQQPIGRMFVYECSWCKGTSAVSHDNVQHFANCLYALAHAETPED